MSRNLNQLGTNEIRLADRAAFERARRQADPLAVTVFAGTSVNRIDDGDIDDEDEENEQDWRQRKTPRSNA